MSRKEEFVSLTLSVKGKKSLEQLAIKYGCLWGEKPNISKLIQQIAAGQLKIIPENDKILETQTLLESSEVKRVYKLLKDHFEDQESANKHN